MLYPEVTNSKGMLVEMGCGRVDLAPRSLSPVLGPVILPFSTEVNAK